MSLIVIPDELDAMIESTARHSSSCAIQLLLEVEPLGSVFLDEVGLATAPPQIGRERQAVARCAGGEADARQRRPGLVDELAQLASAFGADRSRRRRIPGRGTGGPARADDSGADDGDAANGFVVWYMSCSPMRWCQISA